MKATLINYTGYGNPDPARFAAAILIFCKNTRVKMEPKGVQHYYDLSYEDRNEELEYIANTIPGSWEMVDYTFLLEGVTRNFTHQLVRTRTASYAQQTMQILDVSGFYEAGGYRIGPSIIEDENRSIPFKSVIKVIDGMYRMLIDQGAKVEDARDLLPCGIHTNVVVKANLRTLVDFCRSRIGPRNMGETVEVTTAMRDVVMEVHPWANLFLNSDADDAARQLDKMINTFVEDKGQRNLMLKMVDRMRRKG